MKIVLLLSIFLLIYKKYYKIRKSTVDYRKTATDTERRKIERRKLCKCELINIFQTSASSWFKVDINLSQEKSKNPIRICYATSKVDSNRKIGERPLFQTSLSLIISKMVADDFLYRSMVRGMMLNTKYSQSNMAQETYSFEKYFRSMV